MGVALAAAAWVAIAAAQETPAPTAPAGTVPPRPAAAATASPAPPAEASSTAPAPAADAAEKSAPKSVGATGGSKSSPQRFEPTEKVRPDFDVAFPIDI